MTWFFVDRHASLARDSKSKRIQTCGQVVGKEGSLWFGRQLINLTMMLQQTFDLAIGQPPKQIPPISQQGPATNDAGACMVSRPTHPPGTANSQHQAPSTNQASQDQSTSNQARAMNALEPQQTTTSKCKGPRVAGGVAQALVDHGAQHIALRGIAKLPCTDTASQASAQPNPSS